MYPVGFFISTVTSSPLPTVISEIPRLLVVASPDNAPLVAPITVISLAAKVVRTTMNVSVKLVEAAV